MKIMGLCFLLLLAVCFTRVSYAQADSSRIDSSQAKSSKAKSGFPAVHFANGVMGRLIVSVKPDATDWLDHPNPQDCAYMRTYRVKRQARGSDGVVPAGYTTCVPTGRFEMRSAVETRTDSGDDTPTDSGGDTQKP